MTPDQEKPDTINMLLDVEKFSGEHTGRMAPVMVFLLLVGAPALFIIYNFVGVINLLYILPFYIVYSIWVGLITIGRQGKRVEEYKRQLNDQYSSVLDLMNNKTVHPDGCVEFVHNKVGYFILAKTGSIDDQLMRAQTIRRLLLTFDKSYTLDIHVYNVTASDSLSSRYDGVKFFSDKEVAKDFISLIDHNRKIISEKSLLMEVAFFVKAPKKEFKNLKRDILSALTSQDAKAFRTVELASAEKAEYILSNDIDATIDFDEMQIKKYASGNYYGSRVVGYDLEDQVEEKEIIQERGFMVHE